MCLMGERIPNGPVSWMTAYVVPKYLYVSFGYDDVMLVQAVHDARGNAPTPSHMLFFSAGNNLDGNFPLKSEMHNMHVKHELIFILQT